MTALEYLEQARGELGPHITEAEAAELDRIADEYVLTGLLPVYSNSSNDPSMKSLAQMVRSGEIKSIMDLRTIVQNGTVSIVEAPRITPGTGSSVYCVRPADIKHPEQ